jgi:hypothetical protein
MKWLLPCLLWLAGPAAAQDIVIYRCTDAQGNLAVQNQPCPKGTRQEKRTMQTPAAAPLPPAPTPVAPPPAPSPVPDAAAEVKTEQAPPVAPPVAVEKPAPPALYDCRRRDDTRYLTQDLANSSYCVPMQVTGLDGNPLTGAGEACEVVKDTCDAVADDQLCAAWQQRLDEAETHWRFATPEHAATLQQEYARVRDLIAASRCADGADASAATHQKP